MLERALSLLRDLAFRESCSFWNERMSPRRPPGETCSQYMTDRTGGPHPGCAVCRAQAFLRENDPVFVEWEARDERLAAEASERRKPPRGVPGARKMRRALKRR